jgi:uncharacterized membrane protein
MRTFCALLLGVGLAALVGCNRDQSGPPKADSFKIKGPATMTAIKQGETKMVNLTLDRGKDFKENVKLSADNPPKGFKVEFEPAEVKASDKAEAQMKVIVEKDAAVGEHKVKVTGKPDKGDAQSAEVTLKVEKVEEAK